MKTNKKNGSFFISVNHSPILIVNKNVENNKKSNTILKKWKKD